MKKRHYEGVVYPIVTPFKHTGELQCPIDYESLDRYLNYLIEQGAKILMVASATSRFAQLTIEEIKEVNKRTLEIANGRAMVVASTPIQGSTFEHIEVAQHAESVGFEHLACEYPWRFQSIPALTAYYQSILDSTEKLKLMVHVTPGRSELGGLFRYDVESLEALFELPRVVAMKEASGDAKISQAIWESLATKCDIVVAGKASQTFLESQPQGACAFFAGTGSIMPQHSQQAYELLGEGRTQEAKELVEEFEMKFLVAAKNYGWHASLKAALAELGLMELTERAPMVPITPTQREHLASIMRECGWLD